MSELTDSLNQIASLAQSALVQASTLESQYVALALTQQATLEQLDEANARIAELESELGPSTLIGANVTTVATVDMSTYKGNAEIGRIYLTSSQSMSGKTWFSFPQMKLADDMGIKTIVLSAWETNPTIIQTFLKTKPSDVTVYFCYAHEPENNQGAPGTATYKTWSNNWKANWAKIGPAVRAAGCVPVSILMAWTLDARSKRDIADWTPPAGAVDVFAFDAYYNEGKDPVALYNDCAEAAKKVGLPTAIAETGTVVEDPDRAAKTAAAKKAAIDNKFVFAMYWNSSTPGYDFRFKPDTADAWWN